MIPIGGAGRSDRAVVDMSNQLTLASEVRPKGGYDVIKWRKHAKLICSKDLKRDNTVLCRTGIKGP